MLNHDRISVGDIDGLCKHSKKTVATGPSTPMLIWQARARAIAMASGLDTGAAMVWTNAQGLGDFAFATKRAGASPLLDGGVSARMWESTSTVGGYSLPTPAYGTASTAEAGAFTLNGDNIVASILAWHPHGVWIANGARYGFSLMSDGAVRRQEDTTPPFDVGEAKKITEWLAK